MRVLLSVTSLALCAIVVACREDCPVGSEGCPCTSGGICIEGLNCNEGTCVMPEGGGTGSGGTNGTGGSGIGAGGAPVSGGTSATGGAGTGGSATGGSGGSATGGTAATGGATGTGGTATGSNLIQNGDFTLGDQHWQLTPTGGHTTDTAGGQYCMTNVGGGLFSYSLGYPAAVDDAFALQAGVAYTLSFRVQGSANFTAKVGLAVDPFTAVDEFDVIESYPSLTTVTNSFTPGSAQSQVGVVFNGSLAPAESVCFDDVSVTQD